MEYEYFPAREASPGGPRVLVLMHGRGADRHDLAGLRMHLPADWHLVLPDAPHGGAQWGYGTGRAWYRFLGDDVPDPESLAESLVAVDDLLEVIATRTGTPATLVAGGFSQGGTMGHAYALTRPGRLQGVLNFSGFLPSNVPLAPAALEATKFFWGHGLSDPSIPFSLAERGRAALLAAGAELEAKDYAIGHWIDAAELADAAAWLGGLNRD